jgi:Outer membrane protein beta-barrel domain
MKQIYCLLLILLPAYVLSQQDSVSANSTKNKTEKKPRHSLGLGIKVGLNFTNITSASSISNSSETGYQVGLFLDPSSSSILSSRTELVYSHQGYNYSTGTTTGTNYLNYIMLAQLMAINITHFVQIQIGSQIAYLLSAQADSNKISTGNASADAALNYYNRIDFGFSGGVEVRPFMGVLVGARYNLSITNLYKIPDVNSTQTPPSFVPSSSDLNFKNNLVQVYVGYRF